MSARCWMQRPKGTCWERWRWGLEHLRVLTSSVPVGMAFSFLLTTDPSAPGSYQQPHAWQAYETAASMLPHCRDITVLSHAHTIPSQAGIAMARQCLRLATSNRSQCRDTSAMHPLVLQAASRSLHP